MNKYKKGAEYPYRHAYYSIIPIRLLLLMLFFFTACNENNKLSGQNETLKPLTKQITAQNHFDFISNLQLPQKLDFCGEEAPLHIEEVRERAEREFYLLLQQPGQLILYLKRAGRYFPMIEQKLKENKMPDDIKYLAVAESALYMSRSSKNALGLWQFMEATGRMFGLIINSNVDERCHPERSTEAALKYLKQGYQNLGSWSLAAAGYNMGQTGVKNRLSHQGADGYFDLYLNEETSRFVFRIMIIKELMKNAAKYGITLSENQIYQPYQGDIVKVNTPINDLSVWAKERGFSYKDIRIMNPWILDPKLPAPPSGSSYEILVPKK